ncbi:hypothetical protein AM232_18345 [Bacillus sp. FJAT-21352]|nr:hypothetical protein DOZ91_22380 [Peribacillus frigoritolerans]KOR80207.1 hypothetical protein AM232_18345 [Bacillus sp. FJAT-21352]
MSLDVKNFFHKKKAAQQPQRNRLDYLYPLIKSITIAKTITPISNNGPMPELYTKYTVMWRKMSTTRNRNNRKHKIMIRAVFLFRYK